MMTRLGNSVLVAVLVISGPAAAQQAVQWRVEDGGNGHWYQGVRHASGLAWAAASAAATARGGHLATATSAAENQFIISTVIPTLSPFGSEFGPILGGRYVSGSWVWVTGEPWSFTAWVPGEPSSPSFEQYLHYQLPTLGWNDYDGGDGTSYSAPFRTSIVEWSADCNGDGLVDYGQCRDGSLPDFNGNNTPDCCELGAACVVGDYPIQWRTQEGGNGNWYQLRPKVGDWFACRAAAQASHGDLASPSTQAENSLIERIVPPKQFPIWNRVFLGGRQLPGSAPNQGWFWVDGSEWTYTDWYINQPDGGELFLVTMPEDNGCTWGDYPADSGDIYYYIIEWSADCNGDGIVDYGQILQGQLADTNGNGVPDPCEPAPCLGDVSGNGVVDGVDLAAVLGSWGSGGKGEFNTDIDGDGVVGGADLTIVLNDWGPCS